MRELNKTGLIVLICLVLSACQTHQSGRTLFKDRKDIDGRVRRLVDYKTKRVEIDYIANCKARIKTESRSRSGSCEIVATHLGQFRLLIHHPLAGTVFVLYADEEVIQLLDRVEREFWEVENNRSNRRKIPALMGLSIAELRAVLWGREIDAVTNSLRFQYKNGRPYRVESLKEGGGLRVVYKKWLNYKGLFFPKTIRIENSEIGLSVMLIITEFNPGMVENLKIEKIPVGYSRRYF